MAQVRQLADNFLSCTAALPLWASPDAAWSVVKRVLTVHPGVYLSALMTTWVALLVCQSLNREADMRATAQRIQVDETVVAQSGSKPESALTVATSTSPAASPAPANDLPRPDAGMFAPFSTQLMQWQANQTVTAVQPVVLRPVPASKKPRIASGLVPPPPPTGLVPPPPPTVPIPTAMLTQSSPSFGQSIAAVAPIPGGPGAAAAANEMAYTAAAYTPAPPVMGAGAGDSLYYAPAGRSGDSYKVVQHRQRKRTIAYR